MSAPEPPEDGVIPLYPDRVDPESEGCGVRGCLIAVMVIFAVLLLVLVIGLLTRVWVTPAPGIR
jgi:hypothetical protein